MNLLIRVNKLIFLVVMVVGFSSLAWVGGVSADQKELMDEWAKHKKQITEKIVMKLKQEGKLPQYGTIEFNARVKPLPSGDLDIVIDNVKVYSRSPDSSPSNSDKNSVNMSKVRTTEDDRVAREFQEIFRPRNPSPYWTTGTIDISGGVVSSEKFRFETPKSESQDAGQLEKEKQQISGSPGKVSNSEEKVETPPREETPKEETSGWWDRFWQWLSGKSQGGK
ncbi:MAG: hypothetical protein WHS38_09835 [Thermodesulforhabdaceae bacterium]